MQEFYDAIYLSPHLDDAALSCGGQIVQRTARGERVLVLTVMAGDPPASAESEFARSLHDRWELASDVVAARRAEDTAACGVLGAEAAYWEIGDCIYRTDAVTGESFYASEEGLFGMVAPLEMDGLVAELAQRLSRVSAEAVFAPLAVGNHVDHQIVRAAAERAFGTQMRYYEDYPYAQNVGALEQVVGSAEWHGQILPLTEVELQTKIDAIAEFASQLGTFFSDWADLDRQVRAYAARVGGERIWKKG